MTLPIATTRIAIFVTLTLSIASTRDVVAQDTVSELTFAVEAELLVGDQFDGSEGIAFNGEGRLFVTAIRALWEDLANTCRRERSKTTPIARHCNKPTSLSV